MLHPLSTRRSRVATATAALAALAGAAAPALAAPGVTPASYSDALDPGTSVTVTKTVETPPIPPNPDIVFLSDTTGSMDSTISNVQSNAASILNQVKAAQPTAEFAVAEYRDAAVPGAELTVDQDLTSSSSAVTSAINGWTAAGGGDTPEDWIGGLAELPSRVSFRSNGTPIVVMFGDASSHDPSAGHTLANAIANLTAAHIRVIAINVNTGAADGLDAAGQATAVANATGGTLSSADPNQVSNVILSQLNNLPATVTHSATCDSGLSASLTPASQTVTSGDSTTFSETLTVAPDATQGATLHCTVDFPVNGSLPSSAFTQHVAITVNDVTPPVVTVSSETVEATSAAGAVVSYTASANDNVDGPLTPSCIPPSGSVFPIGSTVATCTATDAAGNTGTGTGVETVVDTTPPTASCSEGPNPGGKTPKSKNPDGFYLLHATDIVDPDPAVYVKDTGSSTVWGPFHNGQDVKYTQAPGATPSQQSMPGGIVHLTGKGDGAIYAVDSYGNASAPVACLVVPPKGH